MLTITYFLKLLMKSLLFTYKLSLTKIEYKFKAIMDLLIDVILIIVMLIQTIFYILYF